MQINYVDIPQNAKIYLCGPTLYNDIHIGNLRSMIVVDVLFRALPDSMLIRNITDIDDKIIALTDNIYTFTDPIIQRFHEDINRLGLKNPTYEPRATDYINTMIYMIQILIDNKFAYVHHDGHVLFDVSQYKSYGMISNKRLEANKHNIRKIIDSSFKEEIYDFVLWKPDKKFWNSPWGKGRPGWHIECSAMIYEICKGPIDIHCGGIDLQFPHHENENAQSCCAFNYTSLSKVWLHNAMLTINGSKMSKSEGNIITVRNALDKYHATTIRIAMLNTIYYKPLDWNESVILQSKKIANKIYRFFSLVDYDTKYICNDESLIIKAIHNNLNTPLAIHILQELLKQYYIDKSVQDDILYALNVLGLSNTYQSDMMRIDIKYIEDEYRKYLEYQHCGNYIQADHIRSQIPYIEMHSDRWNIIDR